MLEAHLTYDQDFRQVNYKLDTAYIELGGWCLEKSEVL
jgi:hypothetical protein